MVVRWFELTLCSIVYYCFFLNKPRKCIYNSLFVHRTVYESLITFILRIKSEGKNVILPDIFNKRYGQ